MRTSVAQAFAGERRRVRAARQPVGAENLCHQAIFVDDAARAVMPPDLEMIRVGDAIWQGPQWRGLVQGAVRPVGVVPEDLPHRRRRHDDAEPGKLTVDPLVMQSSA